MKIPKPIQDRRRAVRIDESLAFRIGHDNYEIEVRTVNISLTGVLCLSDKPLPLMTKVKVALSLPSGGSNHSKEQVIRANGVVVRREPDPASGKFYVAIFFSEIKTSDLKILEEFVERRLEA